MSAVTRGTSARHRSPSETPTRKTGTAPSAPSATAGGTPGRVNMTPASRGRPAAASAAAGRSDARSASAVSAATPSSAGTPKSGSLTGRKRRASSPPASEPATPLPTPISVALGIDAEIDALGLRRRPVDEKRKLPVLIAGRDEIPPDLGILDELTPPSTPLVTSSRRSAAAAAAAASAGASGAGSRPSTPGPKRRAAAAAATPASAPSSAPPTPAPSSEMPSGGPASSIFVPGCVLVPKPPSLKRWPRPHGLVHTVTIDDAASGAAGAGSGGGTGGESVPASRLRGPAIAAVAVPIASTPSGAPGALPSADEDRIAEYDMDSEDEAWLREQRRRTPELTADRFECMMEVLEKKAFRMWRKRRNMPTCAVCGNIGVAGDESPLTPCAMCLVRVHRECYGGDGTAGSGSRAGSGGTAPWTCDACRAVLAQADSGGTPSATRAVRCCLCTRDGGALKQTDDGRFVHVVCALVVPGVVFRNPRTRTGIIKIDEALKRAVGNGPCDICHSASGAPVRCSTRGCRVAVHASCALSSGILHSASEARPVPHCPAHAQSALPPVREEQALKLLGDSAAARAVYAHWMARRRATPYPLLTPLLMSDVTHAWVAALDGDERSYDRRSARVDLTRMRDLRFDLERARILCDIVKRRERLKHNLISAAVEASEAIVHSAQSLRRSVRTAKRGPWRHELDELAVASTRLGPWVSPGSGGTGGQH